MRKTIFIGLLFGFVHDMCLCIYKSTANYFCRLSSLQSHGNLVYFSRKKSAILLWALERKRNGFDASAH